MLQQNQNYSVQMVSTGLRDILISIKNETLLHRLKPDLEEVKVLSNQCKASGAILVRISMGGSSRKLLTIY